MALYVTLLFRFALASQSLHYNLSRLCRHLSSIGTGDEGMNMLHQLEGLDADRKGTRTLRGPEVNNQARAFGRMVERSTVYIVEG
jgi:hypothetical protein